MAEFKWGVICSVSYTDTLQDEIYDFFCWLLPCLTDASEDINEFYQFNKKESFYYRCDPDSYDQICKCYDYAAVEHPEVMIIFQILPYRNSKEVDWCRDLSQNRAQFVQSILIDNIRSHFDGIPFDAVCQKMVTYFHRRLEELHNYEYKRKADLTQIVVNPFEKDTPTEIGTGTEDVTDVIRLVLHNSRFLEKDVPAAIIVSGYPACFGSNNIASLFGLLNILTVQPYRPSMAFVQFLNNEQALQALLNLHNTNLGAGYTLILQPKTTVLEKKLKEARNLWKFMGVEKSFPYDFKADTF